MKKIITIIFCITTLTSCFYTAMYHLTGDDKKWLGEYKEGDVLLFTSEFGVDTMTITERKVVDKILPFVENESSDTFHANASINFTIKHSGSEISGWLIIVKKDDSITTLHIRIGDRQYNLDDTKQVVFSKKARTVNTLDDVISIDVRNSELYIKSKFTPDYFLWSKSKGLIQYQYQNGETYSFYKKLTNKNKKGF